MKKVSRYFVQKGGRYALVIPKEDGGNNVFWEKSPSQATAFPDVDNARRIASVLNATTKREVVCLA